jgi:hypothetical protein
MSEIVLKTIVEKLETLENAIKELKEKINGVTDYSADFKKLQGDYREIKMVIASIPPQISIPADEIKDCSRVVVGLTTQLKQPLKQIVKHIHYASKPLFLCSILFSVIIGLCMLVSYELDIVSSEKENDIKYRAINLSIDNNLTRAIGVADSLYFENPAALKKRVEELETRRKEILDSFQRSARDNNENQKVKKSKMK